MYVAHYSWYPMSPTLHRLLMHSAAIVQQCILPVGMMSEEAAEARTKKYACSVYIGLAVIPDCPRWLISSGVYSLRAIRSLVGPRRPPDARPVHRAVSPS